MSHAQPVSWFSRDPGGSTVYVKPEPDPESDDEFVELRASRFFWWSASDLTYRWRPLYIGGTDEFDNTTLGVRLPGGVLFMCLNWPLKTVDMS